MSTARYRVQSTTASELAGYVPYHADLDIHTRLPLNNSEDHTTTQSTDDENDP